VTGKSDYPSEHVKTHYFKDGEFPLFLASCDVVITLSTMIEGWNRTAHESILVGTPVIGSGTGGMQELLEKTKQTILSDTKTLNLEIEKCLKKDNKVSEDAKNYLSQYNLTYFKSNWKRVIAELL
jgi:glycosyltransferase involved in cell wall biosynthesis